MAREALIDHLKSNALRTDGPFILRSGEISDWYLDARQTTFDGPGAVLVARAVLQVLRDDIDAVGGMTMGADPIAMATAIAAAGEGRHLRAFSVRKGDKDHGTGGRLVGPVRVGMRLAVVEDTTTTGGAVAEAVDYLLGHGFDVLQVISLVDRSDGRTGALFADMGIDYTAVVAPRDLGVET